MVLAMEPGAVTPSVPVGLAPDGTQIPYDEEDAALATELRRVQQAIVARRRERQEAMRQQLALARRQLLEEEALQAQRLPYPPGQALQQQALPQRRREATARAMEAQIAGTGCGSKLSTDCSSSGDPTARRDDKTRRSTSPRYDVGSFRQNACMGSRPDGSGDRDVNSTPGGPPLQGEPKRSSVSGRDNLR